MHLELVELLSSLSLSGEDTENVETDSLFEGPALANDDLVTGLDTESGGDVGGEVLVALLVTGVLGDEVKVFTADDQGACTALVPIAKRFLVVLAEPCVRSGPGYSRTVHLGGHDSSGQDTATDGDHAGEWALLVDALLLVVLENVRLLLESALRLDTISQSAFVDSLVRGFAQRT